MTVHSFSSAAGAAAPLTRARVSGSLPVWSLSLGCPKNRVDTEHLLGSLGMPVHSVEHMGRARLVFINTCGFIEPAVRESIRSILDGTVFRAPITLPSIKHEKKSNQSIMDALGLSAFKLFKDRQMAVFFIFSMLLGVALQITNGYATPFISHFQALPEFASSWGAKNATAIYSVSQIAETLGILLIPFAMKKFGIKNVMLTAMLAWVLRFGLFGLGDTGSGVWMIILSCIVYGVAFDFFNISGSLYVNQRTSGAVQNSAQGLFMLMTNGIGATVGTLTAQAIVNHFTHEEMVNGIVFRVGDWQTCWMIFAGYALVVAILFFIFFKKPGKDESVLV